MTRMESRKAGLNLTAADHKSAANFLIDWLEKQNGFDSIQAVGHRVVHGMKHTEPEIVTQDLLDELHRISPNDPDHLPREIELMETFRQRHPKLPQVACFDTAFHQTMPRVAKLLPIPRRFDAKGIQRYGFHGLSYAYLMEELARLGDPAATKGRVILAHLGNGASLAAVRDGKSIDTSMGFTPTAGLVMSTRTGDLDPGLAPFLGRTEHMTTKQFYEMVNHKSGLLGVSETSSDMRDLLDHEQQDVRAAEAVALFCYQAKKWIGSFAAALGGLDTLVFAGVRPHAGVVGIARVAHRSLEEHAAGALHRGRIVGAQRGSLRLQRLHDLKRRGLTDVVRASLEGQTRGRRSSCRAASTAHSAPSRRSAASARCSPSSPR